MKILCLIVFLSATLHCKGQKNEVFTTIIASGNKIFLGRSDKLHEAKELETFDTDVSSLAIYNNYLYVSTHYKYNFLIRNFYSEIRRVKLTNSTTIGIDSKSWEKVSHFKLPEREVISIFGTKGYIYAGRNDGTMWRCPADDKGTCKIFSLFDNHPIVGIDYNPKDDKMYVALGVGNIRLCSPDEGYGKCDIINFHVEKILAVKIAFDALWLRVVKNHGDDARTWLMKCPIPKVVKEFDDSKCQNFEEPLYHNALAHGSLEATRKHVYFNVWNRDEIYRCQPTADLSCTNSISTRGIQTVDRFVIV